MSALVRNSQKRSAAPLRTGPMRGRHVRTANAGVRHGRTHRRCPRGDFNIDFRLQIADLRLQIAHEQIALFNLQSAIFNLQSR
jgi:hypothetical protein